MAPFAIQYWRGSGGHFVTEMSRSGHCTRGSPKLIICNVVVHIFEKLFHELDFQYVSLRFVKILFWNYEDARPCARQARRSIFILIFSLSSVSAIERWRMCAPQPSSRDVLSRARNCEISNLLLFFADFLPLFFVFEKVYPGKIRKLHYQFWHFTLING